MDGFSKVQEPENCAEVQHLSKCTELLWLLHQSIYLILQNTDQEELFVIVEIFGHQCWEQIWTKNVSKRIQRK